MPIDRLLRSAETYLAAHPNSAEAHYTLARIHYLAFVRSSLEVPAMVRNQDLQLDAQGKPRVAAGWQLLPGRTGNMDARAFELATAEVGYSQPHPRTEPEKFRKYKAAYDRHLVSLQAAESRRLQQERWTNPAALADEKALAHVTAALAGFREAMRLPPEAQVTNTIGEPTRAPTHGLYELGLASLMEQFADWKQLRKPVGLSAASSRPELRCSQRVSRNSAVSLKG